eukprot:2469145-Pleurochrysis_carterae.AAC.1
MTGGNDDSGTLLRDGATTGDPVAAQSKRGGRGCDPAPFIYVFFIDFLSLQTNQHDKSLSTSFMYDPYAVWRVSE